MADPIEALEKSGHQKADTAVPDEQSAAKAGASYWSDVVRLTAGLLTIWFAVSFGAGILLRDTLDQFSIGGAPLGFWFSQQGSIYIFLMLIVIYCIAMNRLERKHGIED